MSNPQHEPTMEEILASIRKIISEDAPEAAAPAIDAAPAVPAAPAAPAASPVNDDVLELTHEVEAPPAPVAPPPAPAPVSAAPAPVPVEDLVFQNVAPAPHSDIFSDHTRKALEDAFDSIPEESAPAPAPEPVQFAPPAPVHGSRVENVFARAVRESFEPVLQNYLADNSAAVIDGMKPLIREWMDEHFPALLEGAVRAEVERVVKSRGTKR
jgi:cell pole-organizing protein PopZ